MARDDFPQPVIAVLAKRVAHRCSNPKCRCITTGPHTEVSKAINVGVAAHITAASPGGARHEPALTTGQRKEASNGIWLCQTCAKLIDNDVDRYPTNVLLEWKSAAESAALSELETGGPPPIDQSAIQFAVDDWTIWRTRGNLPGDSVVFVSQWARGDLRYACKIRLRSTHANEEQLHHLRMQYRLTTDILYEDEYVFQREVVLLPQKWETLDVSHGLHGSNEDFFSKSDSLWFAAELVGSPRTFAWKVADFDHSTPILIAE